MWEDLGEGSQGFSWEFVLAICTDKEMGQGWERWEDFLQGLKGTGKGGMSMGLLW